MVSFETFFEALKKAPERRGLFEIWPDFEPVYDEAEYSWADLMGLGMALIPDCALAMAHAAHTTPAATCA